MTQATTETPVGAVRVRAIPGAIGRVRCYKVEKLGDAVPYPLWYGYSQHNDADEAFAYALELSEKGEVS